MVLTLVVINQFKTVVIMVHLISYIKVAGPFPGCKISLGRNCNAILNALLHYNYKAYPDFHNSQNPPYAQLQTASTVAASIVHANLDYSNLLFLLI